MSAAKILDITSIANVANVAADAAGSIGVGQGLLPEEVIRLTHEKGLLHVVQKDAPCFDSEMAVSRLMQTNPKAFLDFPLETILGLSAAPAPGAEGFYLNASVADRKADALNKFEEFLDTVKGLRSMREQAIMVADELYSNGAKMAYDPRSLARGSKLVHPNNRVEFFARAEGSRLLIGARDSFGLLEFGQVLGRVALCFNNGIGQSIKQGEGGAGIGSFMVFNAALSYYAGVERGVRTVVCVSLPLGVKRDEATNISKNIHLCTD